MKEKLTRLRDGFASGRLPFYALAAVGLLTIPVSWCGPLLAALLVAQLLCSPKMLSRRAFDFWREPEAQRTIVGGAAVWLFAWLRTQSADFLTDMNLPSYGQNGTTDVYVTLIIGIACIVLPYAGIWLAGVRTFPKAINADVNRHRKLQSWTSNCFIAFMSAFVLVVLAIFNANGGLAQWVSSWITSSAYDANLTSLPTTAVNFFDRLVTVVLSIGVIAMLWGRATRLAAFLTSFARQAATVSVTKYGDSFLRALRAPRTVLKLKEVRPFIKNIASTLLYLLGCYAFLFWLCGFSKGDLGNAIENWLLCSVRDSNILPDILNGFSWTGHFANEPTVNKVRIFCAAIVSLYGTVPFAIMTCPILPYFTRRELFMTTDGIIFPDGPFLSLAFRQMILWTDIASVDYVKKTGQKAGSILIKLHSGGKITLREKQLDARSLDKFLGAIDEHAENCIVTDAVVALRAEIRSKIASDGKQTDLGNISAQNFQSTIFVPHDLGSWLPNGEARVVRLLASRPLSCVYLVRLNNGKLAIAKQFFLADDNEQAQALRKTFEREYELLSKLNHERVSKVLEVFHRDQSTYLLIEHAAGIDLRKLVESEGPQSEAVVIDWALQVCDILRALHDQDPPIVHRDLTPDNLIVADDGSLRLIDFGAAHQFMEGITGTIIGKQSYVPPEQLRGLAGPKSDIYSLGCTLHFLLTGQEPKALTQCEPKKILEVSDEMNRLVRACTEFDEGARPDSFEEIALLLKHWKEDRAPGEVLRKLAVAAIETATEDEQEEREREDCEKEDSEKEDAVVINVSQVEKEKVPVDG